MNISTYIRKGATAAKVFWRSHGATVLTVGGTVATVAGTVMACKATLKVDEVMKPHEEDIAKIEGVHKGEIILPEGQVYTEKDYRTDIVKAKTAAGKDLIKLYWPAGVTIIGGVAAILGGHGMIKKQNAALVTAYTAVDRAFADYRNRVRMKEGNDADLSYRFPLVEETQEVEKVNEETGEVSHETKKSVHLDPDTYSVYARWFDESSEYWRPDPIANQSFLKGRQNWLNDRLRSEKVLFLNDVYKELGLPTCREGNLVGWRISEDGSTDNYVDFGVFNRADGAPKFTQCFLDGLEDTVLLDFNVDGYILDTLPKVENGRGSGWHKDKRVRRFRKS